MNAFASPGSPSLDDLRQKLAHLVHEGTPAISGLANWALHNPQELAFQSVRGLATLAEVNVNTVYRLAVALGFPGYEACRAAFQAALRADDASYRARAARLSSGALGDVSLALRRAAQDNLDTLFAEPALSRIGEAATLLTGAGQVHVVGVRSCFSLAHYLSYTGHMAFSNFARPMAEPGSISDLMAAVGPEDVVVPITFSLYSSEVVRAHGVARARGARVLSITDSYASPIAQGAALTFCIPMQGPQTLPSLGAGFALVEAIIAEMIARDPAAPDRIAEFEGRLLEFGGYLPHRPGGAT